MRDNQERYYKAIEDSSSVGESTPFNEFMLEVLLDTITATPQDTPQDTLQATPQDERLCKIVDFCAIPRSRKEIQEYIGIKDRKYFKEAILDKLLDEKYIEMTLPDSPRSPNQKYRKISL